MAREVLRMSRSIVNLRSIAPAPRRRPTPPDVAAGAAKKNKQKTKKKENRDPPSKEKKKETTGAADDPPTATPTPPHQKATPDANRAEQKKKRVRRLFRRPLWGVSSVFLFYFFCQRSASFLFCFASDVANFILKKQFLFRNGRFGSRRRCFVVVFFLFWLASASAWRRADGWKSASDQRRRSMPL